MDLVSRKEELGRLFDDTFDLLIPLRKEIAGRADDDRWRAAVEDVLADVDSLVKDVLDEVAARRPLSS